MNIDEAADLRFLWDTVLPVWEGREATNELQARINCKAEHLSLSNSRTPITCFDTLQIRSFQPVGPTIFIAGYTCLNVHFLEL